MINWPTIIVSVISFLLGIFGSLFLQWRADRTRLNRIKGALELHLKEIILEECEQLAKDYTSIIIAIQKHNYHRLNFSAFERFDSEIYKANNPSDYFKIYGSTKDRKFEKLVSIYAVISFLKENLPSELYSKYMTEINSHLDKDLENGENKFVHFSSCSWCDVIRNNYKSTFESRLNEIEDLKKLIAELLRK